MPVLRCFSDAVATSTPRAFMGFMLCPRLQGTRISTLRGYLFTRRRRTARGRFVVMTMTKERDNPTAEAEVDSIPVDVECIREGLIHALELPLATTTLRRST